MRKAAAVFAAVIISSLTSFADNTHNVKKGDTLWGLSGEYYGDNAQWPKIWFGNVAINNPDLIMPNDKLQIPSQYVEGESFRLENTNLFKLSDTSVKESKSLSLEQSHSQNSYRTVKLNGYDVALDKVPPFTIISIEEERELATIDTEIVVNAGRAQGLNDGDTIAIYEKRSKLEQKHFVFSCVAYAKIVQADENVSSAVIVKAFSSVSKGFVADKGGELTFMRPQGYKNVSTDIHGDIIYLSEEHKLSAAGYTAISNIGLSHSVKEGDKFDVIRTVAEHNVTKSYIVGEAQIILLSDKFSTIYFISTEKEIKKGDKIRLSKVSVF